MSSSLNHAAHIFYPVHQWEPEFREGTDGDHAKQLLVHEQVALQVAVLTAQIKAAVEASCLERGVLPDAIRRLLFVVHLALDELIPNTLKHGHGGDPNKKLVVEWGIESDMLEMRFSDEGPGFDVQAAMEYDPTTSETLEDPGGRGMFLVKSFMDEVTHNDNGTQFTLRKKLVPQEETAV
jgi:serine/threonine-protein kinase RsbW